jgi:cell division protein FtsN
MSDTIIAAIIGAAAVITAAIIGVVNWSKKKENKVQQVKKNSEETKLELLPANTPQPAEGYRIALKKSVPLNPTSADIDPRLFPNMLDPEMEKIQPKYRG